MIRPLLLWERWHRAVRPVTFAPCRRTMGGARQTAAGAVASAQGGGGGDGDSAGRGPDTSKGAVPKDQGYPSGQYPSGITSPGTAPALAPRPLVAALHRRPHPAPKLVAPRERALIPGTNERRYDADGPVTARTSSTKPRPCHVLRGAGQS